MSREGRFGTTFARVSTALQALYAAGAAAAFLFSVWFVWAPFRFPLELEIREGTVWLHALAKSEGIDIYDGSQVAFVNMNHGPLDPMLKGWILTLFPHLAPFTVTRIFVFALPFALLGAAYVMCHRRIADALLASAAIYLFWSHLTPMMMVGRSDATVLCALAATAVPAHRILSGRRSTWSRRGDRTSHMMLGAFSALAFLISWRNLPTIAALPFVVWAKLLSERRAERWRSLARSLGLFAAGFAATFLAVFLLELHGRWLRYYKRFFAFFREGVWGTAAGPSFRLFPSEVFEGRSGLFVLACALALVGVYRLRRSPGELAAWLFILPASWVAYAYGFYKNQYGGGVHYFCPFLFLAWLFVLRPVDVLFRQRAEPFVRSALALVVLWVIPWHDLVERRNQLTPMRTEAWEFLTQARNMARSEPILSEDVQLFKTRYQGEKIDMGDVAEVIARTGSFGASFNRTFQNYVDNTRSHPPRFVMAGIFDIAVVQGTMSGQLADLLRTQYSVVLKGPNCFVANGMGGPVLFERTAK